MLVETLDYIFNYGETVQEYKVDFFYRLLEMYQQEQRRESAFASQLKQTSEQRLKSKIFGSWKRDAVKKQTDIRKIDRFYHQNLKIKAFFTLLRYCRKKKELRIRDQITDEKVEGFMKERFFKRWRRAYTHKLNQLMNRKCFKVKFSDY